MINVFTCQTALEELYEMNNSCENKRYGIYVGHLGDNMVQKYIFCFIFISSISDQGSPSGERTKTYKEKKMQIHSKFCCPPRQFQLLLLAVLHCKI